MEHYLISIIVCLLLGVGFILCDFNNLNLLQDLGITSISLGIGVIGGAFSSDCL